MKVKTILDEAVENLRAIPVKLSGDDSPLADPWEEVKEQVQNELSFAWPAYLAAINGFISGTVSSLAEDDRAAVAGELKVPANDAERIEKAILNRLLARARKEKIVYEPFDFRYFRHPFADMTVYGEVIRRTGLYTCEVNAYSGAAPFGETGEVNTDTIQATMTADQFEEARRLNWPDEWRDR